MKVVLFILILLSLIGEYFYSRYKLAGSNDDLPMMAVQINSLNSNLACDSVSDCESLPMGDRACGGPEQFVIVSNRNPQLSELKATILKYSALQKRKNEESGSASICSIEQPPPIECRSGICAPGN